jgi:phosphatidylserine decarboxylase
MVLNAQTRGPRAFPCNVNVKKGEELGWFEHGSTIILLAPSHFEFCDNVSEWVRIRAGQQLFRNSSA